jgi:sRNA-binding carbon storage regulator CsrA
MIDAVNHAIPYALCGIVFIMVDTKGNGYVKLGIDAPFHMKIEREEIRGRHR